ncbi:MAG: DEAD/DEAH box helicase [Treponema sp.]|uniref:DNA repair helicase XPB n=1 Tax=Treponema sp. TaxID=166 RepID=UPI0025D60C5D|nr:DNA repair helicase XPB [Treponema sp.]MBR0496852.1 DEAD/DEAH box helicase [Treponema sp.]
MDYSNPLIVQSDRTLLLDVHAPRATDCRNALIPFAELERSPEHLHTYRLTPLSLWNANAAGFSPDDAVKVLHDFARYDVPQSVEMWIKETAGRFGKLRLVPAPWIILNGKRKTENGKPEGESLPLAPAADASSATPSAGDTPATPPSDDGIKIEYLYLVTESIPVFKEIGASLVGRKYLTMCEYEEPQDELMKQTVVSEEEKSHCFRLNLTDRGTIKQELLRMGWPVKDDVPLIDGEPLEINLRQKTLSGRDFVLRQYQKEAAQAIVGDKGPGTGFGTIVLPCGAGKTIVGMTVMDLLKTSTLVITTNISAVHQWIDELIDKTNLTRDDIAEYTGENKTIKPVTVATYQILTWRPEKDGPYPHFSLFRKRNWGLIVYDEVHTLPAPVFRVAAEIQAVRRVGLTATLVREDGCEGHVFSLVGPKRYDVPWKDLESTGFIATAECIEVRIDLGEEKEIEYAVADLRKKHRIASENPKKPEFVKTLVEKSPEDKILVIGQYLSQLDELSKMLGCPIITGKTPNEERDKIYADFRTGKIRVLVVSKVANFAIDLPDASMAIQVSGTFGSRQEEAQRLGRILRPKERKSRFFTLITRNTVEEEFGSNRQKFLAEQGYQYRLIRCTEAKELGEVLDGEKLCLQ